MKPHSLPRTVLALSLSTMAFSAAAVPTYRIDLLGDPAPPAAATHTIAITPHTKYVNVEGGDTVKFLVGQKTFTWHFDVARTISSFNLKQIAPDLLDHPVMVYVEPDPMYRHSAQ